MFILKTLFSIFVVIFLAYGCLEDVSEEYIIFAYILWIITIVVTVLLGYGEIYDREIDR